MTLEPGATVDDRYRVLAHVASGGFGDVYEARRIGIGMKVALKVLRPTHLDPARRAEGIAELLEEARVLAKLHAPGIVEVLDAGTCTIGEAPSVYVALAWCPGVTLRRWLETRATPIPRADAIAIVESLARAMAHAHDAGIAHRDLKPTNVMVDEASGERAVRILDFGIAKAFHEEEGAGTGDTQTGSGSSPHTPGYAAPEQVVGARTGPWTDVHALGLILVELLAGRRAYGAAPAIEAVAPARPTPSALGVDAGPFEQVAARALAVRPSERYPDARAMHVSLRRAARTVGIDLEALPHPAPTARGTAAGGRPIARRLALTSGMVAGAAAVGALATRAVLRAAPPRRLTGLDRAELERRIRRACIAQGFPDEPIRGSEGVAANASYAEIVWGRNRGSVLFVVAGPDTSPAFVCALLDEPATAELDRGRFAVTAIDARLEAGLVVMGAEERVVAATADAILDGMEDLLRGADIASELARGALAPP